MHPTAILCGQCSLVVSATKKAIRYPATTAVLKAVASGTLKYLDGSVKCVDCGNPAIHYDHRDYGKPLEVEPVCGSCNLARGPAKQFVELGIVFKRQPITHAQTFIAKLVQELIDSGLTETAIAERLKEAGITTTQQTINRIKNGVTANARYDVGSAITALHAKVCRKRRAQ